MGCTFLCEGLVLARPSEVFHGDREKDLSIRGGYNVYPREIEEVLYTHPGISEAAVIGKPHDKLGEGIVAHVTLRPDRSTTESEISTPYEDAWPPT